MYKNKEQEKQYLDGVLKSKFLLGVKWLCEILKQRYKIRVNSATTSLNNY